MYMESVFCVEDHQKIIQRMVVKVEKLKSILSFQAIACTGVSGFAVAFPIAYECKLPVIAVRKSGESSHGDKIEMGYKKRIIIHKYLIVDDFIESGSTIRSIIKNINKYDDALECAGILLYDTAHTERMFSYKKEKFPIYKIRNYDI